MTTIREQFEPHIAEVYGQSYELPEVELERVENVDPELRHQTYNILSEGEVVGGVVVEKSRPFDSVAAISLREGEDTKIGKGLGMATYLALIQKSRENGHGFRTGDHMSARAARLWKRLVQAGIAHEVNPIVEIVDPAIDDEPFFSGLCQVERPLPETT